MFSTSRALRIRDLILEKLPKMQTSPAENFAALFYRLGQNVPEHYINQALAATQDCFMRKGRFKDHDAEAYFLATIKAICRERNVKTGVTSWDSNNATKKKTIRSTTHK